MAGANSFRKAAYWGVGSIASAFYFWMFEILRPGYPSAFWFVLFYLAITLFMVTFIMHLMGFIALAKQAKSRFLFWSTLLLFPEFAIFGVLLVFALAIGVSDPNTYFINGLIGLAVTTFYLNVLVFSYALFRIIRFAAFPVLLFTLAIISIWTPWLTMLLFLPSTYYLFIRSTK